jgi:hypothetical protein
MRFVLISNKTVTTQDFGRSADEFGGSISRELNCRESYIIGISRKSAAVSCGKLL